jgi:hypothetical protein
VPARDLAPREPERLLDDQLRDVREAVAHLHHRQSPGEVRHRDAEHGRPLELAQQVDLALRIRRVAAGHACAHVAL